MKTDRNILIAFLLNLFFSIFEFIGGMFTNSVAIISDSIHDLGDAISIGISFFLEKISHRKPDLKYSYGYGRYSVLGGTITTCILLVASLIVIYNAILRLINPLPVNYTGMIWLAIIGIIFNFIAAYFTKDGDSINQKAVNIHMLEDVLTWIVVLIGAIIMNITDIRIIDPILSILVAIFILIMAFKNFKEILDLFLIKTPKDIDITKLKKDILSMKDVLDVHHIHIWSIDGTSNYATMHIVTETKNLPKLKKEIRAYLSQNNICHAILETEAEACDDISCHVENNSHLHHH